MAKFSVNFKRVGKLCKWLLLALALVALIPLGLWLWVSGGVRDVSYLNPYITQSLLKDQPDFAITLGKSHIRWEHLWQPAQVEVDDVTLNYRGEAFFVIPKLALTMDIISAVQGRVQPRDVIARSVAMNVVRNKENQWFWVGQGGQGLPLAALAGVGGAGGQEGAVPPFHSLAIEDADIQLYDEAPDVNYSAKAARIRVVPRSDDGKLYSDFDVALNLADHPAHLAGKAWLDISTYDTLFQLAVKDVNPASLCSFGKWCDEHTPSLDMPLSGNVALKISGKGEVRQSVLDIAGGKGSFTFKPHFPETIMLDSLTLKANIKGLLEQAQIGALSVTMGKTKTKATASVAKIGEAYRVTLDGEATDMPVNDLYKYWPATLAPASREWATTAIRGGVATTASAHIHLEPEDFKPLYFPDRFLRAEVNVKGATLGYIPSYPKAKNVTGKVQFTGTTMTATTKGATALAGTKIKEAKIFFSDLNKPGTPVVIDLSLLSPAADVLEFIKPPRFDFLSRMPIVAASPKGSAEGTIHLAFDAFSGSSSSKNINWDKVDYDIKAQLAGVGGLTYDARYRIDDVSGRFEARSNALTAQLNASINGSPLNVGYDESAGKPARYTLKGTVSESMLRSAGLKANGEIKGPLKVDATVEKRPGGDAISGSADLTAAAVNVDAIGYKKAAGVPAKLTIRPTKSDDNLMVDYQSDALKLNGSVWLDLNAQEVKALALPMVRYGKQDFSLRYSAAAQGKSIELRGRYADLSEWLDDDSQKHSSISDIPAFKLALDMDTLVLGPQRVLRQAKGTIFCTKVRCESANINAHFADKGSMQLRIFRDAGGRQFALNSDDAGNLLRAFDAVDKMYGGEFSLTGIYDDSKSGHPLNGRLTITRFTLKDAPILGRILNLSSLSGLMESLSGSGISFDKLSADIIFANDLATIKGGKASGASLGIMMDGAVNLATSDIRMEGSFAPAHMLNSIISKIPIIGVALAGGEGQSIFAFNYSVNGKYTNPQVSVNPLSVLTPGFTRRLFDVFEKPLPKELQQPSDPKAAPGPTPAPAPASIH